MANNYTLFSEIIPALRDDERAWVVGPTDDPKADPPDLVAAGIAMDAIDPDDWPGFEFELTDPGGDLWIHSEECGNVLHAAELVLVFLTRFRPAACWQMTWAEICSKPRIGEFGGGGVFVTASSVRYCNAREWTARQLRRFEGAKRSGRDRIRS